MKFKVQIQTLSERASAHFSIAAELLDESVFDLANEEFLRNVCQEASWGIQQLAELLALVKQSAAGGK